MTFLNVIEYLKQLQEMDSFIEQNIQYLEMLQKIKSEKYTDLKVTDYTKEKVKNSKNNCADFESIVIKISDMERNINYKIDCFVDKKHDIIKQIQSLKNSNYIKVLFKRYVEYKSFKVIAKEMHYSYQYVIRLHKQALKEFEKRQSKAMKSNQKQ